MVKEVRQFQKRTESPHNRDLQRSHTRGHKTTVSPRVGDIVRFKIENLRKQIAQLHKSLKRFPSSRHRKMSIACGGRYGHWKQSEMPSPAVMSERFVASSNLCADQQSGRKGARHGCARGSLARSQRAVRTNAWCNCSSIWVSDASKLLLNFMPLFPHKREEAFHSLKKCSRLIDISSSIQRRTRQRAITNIVAVVQALARELSNWPSVE